MIRVCSIDSILLQNRKPNTESEHGSRTPDVCMNFFRSKTEQL